MRESIDNQRGELSRRPIVEVQTKARTGLRSNTSVCYEHQQLAEQAEATISASKTPPLCERHL